MFWKKNKEVIKKYTVYLLRLYTFKAIHQSIMPQTEWLLFIFCTNQTQKSTQFVTSVIGWQKLRNGAGKKKWCIRVVQNEKYFC